MFFQLHQCALTAARSLKTAECDLIVLLQKIDACQGFLELGHTSLFVYVTKELGLSEGCALQLITVGRKSVTVPALQAAIAKGDLTVSKAKSIAAILTQENSAEWIGRAAKCSARELERAVANANPQKPTREVVRYKGNDSARVAVDLDKEALEALERVREILAQKQGKEVSIADAFKILARDFVKREDPVAKADRSAARTLHVKSSKSRVHHRDRGRCQYELDNGQRCRARKWLHIHHIVPKSEGGSDDPANLVTLCSAHHRLVHSRGRYANHNPARPSSRGGARSTR